MRFKKITMGDKEEIESIFSQVESRDCDRSFASAWLWKDHYNVDYTVEEGMLIFRSVSEHGTSFSFPVGNGDKKAALRLIREYCREEGIPFKLHSLSKEDEEFLNREYPGVFCIEFSRDDADYVYLAEKLQTLSGKKYHGKRNHINKFMESHQWSYESIDDSNREECLEMLEEWKIQNCLEEDREKHDEICVSRNSLLYMEELGLKGGALRAEGKIIAFSVGEQLTKDTFVVHIEKAFSEIQGAYPMINQQFVIHEAKDCTYINREDDCGEEGLRKAKLSYRPVMMVEKGYACLAAEQECGCTSRHTELGDRGETMQKGA
ncbi:MAG: phosphatidylglycerol lysyltransferase domain-containing protein [Lachnospiraceae bacterium]|nr:phosphatidylglycerol lysyltransferase domain-containing protein [Lachnospiraceae bacterium]